MVTAKDVINSTKQKITKAPGETQKGSAGFDNIRDDIEKTKSLREGEVVKVPANNFDIVNKLALDTHTGDADAHHSQSHNIASHSDTSTTGAEVSFLDGTTVTAGKVLFGDGTKITNDTDLHWDNVNKRLGIGTAAPAEFLDILDDTNTSTVAIKIKTTGTASNAYIYTDGKGNSGYRMSEDGVVKAYVMWNPTDHLSFWEIGHGTVMNIKDGKVGIGNTTPDTLLTVESGDNAIISAVGSTDGDGWLAMKGRKGTGDHMIYWHTTNDLRFGTTTVNNGATGWNELMRIEYGGNVGIGTSSPNQKLTIEGSMSLKEQASANADTVAYGQLWVKNTTPCQLWFTDDAGTDTQIV